MTDDALTCCDMPMSVVPARPQDAPFERLWLCRECGHYEPVEDLDDEKLCADCGNDITGSAVGNLSYDRPLCVACLAELDARTADSAAEPDDDWTECPHCTADGVPIKGTDPIVYRCFGGHTYRADEITWKPSPTSTAADFVVLYPLPPAGPPLETLCGTPKLGVVYDRARPGERLRDAIARHIPDLATQGAGRLRLWFADDFSAWGLEQNTLANHVVAQLGYRHPYGWFGPVAVTMEENPDGDTPPLTEAVRAAIDEAAEGRK